MPDTRHEKVTVDDLLAMGFTQEQVDELVKGSAISPEMIVRFGVQPVTDARQASKQFGRRKQDWEAGRLPAWSVAGYLPYLRDPVVHRAKPRRPFEDKQSDGSVKLAKYAQPKSSGVHVFYGVRLRESEALTDTSVELWITEGEKKVMAAESAGLTCLGLFGVNQWHVKGQKTLHPEMAHIRLEGRKVRLAFDRDAMSNFRVRQQELEFGRALEAAGAIVRVVRFPEDAPKLDDFLATHEFSELAELIEDSEKYGALPPDTTAPTEAWSALFQKLRLDPTTQLPIKDVDNVARILMHHPSWAGVIAYDTRREKQVFLKEPPFLEDVALPKSSLPRTIIDSDISRIGDWLVAQGCLYWTTQPKPTQIDQAVTLAAEQNRFDAVRNYLVGLKWDRKPRLDDMAVKYFGAKDTPYTRAVVSKWMLSAVARARTPGCQVDHVLVLEGDQGLGKSSALRILAGDEYFSDTVPDIPSRDAHEHCVGPWIIELAELDHVRKSEVTALKAFVSARAPIFRSAYARRSMEHPRRCVFAGTTNDNAYLADNTGNRRFWPVECKRIDLAALARDRDQLWAEALVRVRGGESWHITDGKVQAEARREQEARRVVDPWQQAVRFYAAGRQRVTIPDVLDHLGIEKGRFDQRSANRVAALLRELGWARRLVRMGTQRVWVYEPQQAASPVRGDSGDGVVTAQLLDFQSSSPPSPVSPEKPLCNARARAHTPTNSNARIDQGTPIVTEGKSGDSSDSGDSKGKAGAIGVTTLSPLSPSTSDNGGIAEETRAGGRKWTKL